MLLTYQWDWQLQGKLRAGNHCLSGEVTTATRHAGENWAAGPPTGLPVLRTEQMLSDVQGTTRTLQCPSSPS